MKASRWVTLGAAAVGAAVVGPQLWTPAATAPAAALQPAAEPARAEPATDYARLLRRDALGEPSGRAPFASTATPPRAASRKPVAAPIAEAPPPTVPQFPFRWAGRVDLGRTLHQAYFIRGNGELVSVLPGQVVDGVWRIDRLTSERVDVTYLPLAASLPLALADLTAERGGSPPSAEALAQVAPGSAEHSAIERRPSAADSIIAAGPSPRGNATGLVGSAAIAPAAAGRASSVPQSATASNAPAHLALGRLGGEVPTSGSMPGPGNAERGGLTMADATARGIAGGATPQGRMGDATPSGKLGAD